MIQIYGNSKTRTIADTENPRIFQREYRCVGCKEWVVEDEVVWANKDGTLSTDTGEPYCVACVPDEVSGDT